MANFKQTHRRRSSSVCHRHPSVKPTSGFCASCLCERLSTIEAHSSSSSSQLPELRRVRSYSVRNASVSISEQPRRRSCDVRSSGSSLHDLFADDDEERINSSIRKPLVSDLKEEDEEGEEYYDNEDDREEIKSKPKELLEEEIDKGEGDEYKTMKEFIDLDWGNQIKKDNGNDLKEIASVLSRKLKKFSVHHQKTTRKNENLFTRFAGISEIHLNSRHSCDTDPRLSLDAGRISFEEHRASWDGCLIGKTYPKLIPPLSSLTEDTKTFTSKQEKSPGGTVQTQDYYSDSHRRKSFDRSISIKRQGLLEVDELKAISNVKVSPKTVGLFHGAKLLVTEKELRDSNWYQKPELGSETITSDELKHDKVELKKPRKKKWPKGWNIWGLIQRKTETKKEIKTEHSLKLEGNAVQGSLAESLLKLRSVTNGNVSEKLMKSYSVSARKSCDDGVFGSSAIVNEFVGGRSSCDGLFHGSLEVGRSSCDGEQDQSNQRSTKTGTFSRDKLENSLFRFYLTPVRSCKTNKSSKSRLMN